MIVKDFLEVHADLINKNSYLEALEIPECVEDFER